MTGILGAERITTIFGYWPSFHDAEVLRIVLDRESDSGGGPLLTAELATWEITNEVGGDGFLVLRHRTHVVLAFRGVVELELSEFNQQNVLHRLEIEDVAARQLELVKFRVQFASSFGVGAAFGCREVEVMSAVPLEGERAGAAPDDR